MEAGVRWMKLWPPIWFSVFQDSNMRIPIGHVCCAPAVGELTRLTKHEQQREFTFEKVIAYILMAMATINAADQNCNSQSIMQLILLSTFPAF